jgi:dTMP kinase
MSSGRFIVMEGLDGAGTTTQAGLLADALSKSGRDVVRTAEPSGGPVGTMIRQMLARRVVQPSGAPIDRETLALLFAADRLDHLASLVVPALERGADVISDRYYPSSFVYQGDIDGSDEFDISWVRELNSRARVPDLIFFFEIPVEVSLERLGTRAQRDIYETREKLARLETRYAEVIGLLESEGEPVHRLDATRPIDDLAREIRVAVEAL